jgi:chemotaxis protein CheD
MPSLAQEEISNTLYYDRTFDVEAAKISPGEYYYTDKDMMIVTVLGSCVSACVRDVVSGIGGMNHFMLPDSAKADKDSPVSESMRYGTYAMEV